jgi:uncharacterized membrane protein YdjX (TVP38/TMEM64 family)
MFPRPLITLFGVIAFGPWLGFAYAMSGIMLSALVTYCVGRTLSRETVKRLAGEKLERVTGALRDHGLLAVFAMRIVPLAPAPVENIVAGAARIRMWHFLAGTFAGMLPGVLMATVFTDQVFTALDDVSKVNYWLVGAMVLLFAALMYFAYRWVARQAQ